MKMLSHYVSSGRPYYRPYHFMGFVAAACFTIISLCSMPLCWANDSSGAISEEEGGISDPCEGSIEKERAPKGAIASWGNYSSSGAVNVDTGAAAPGDEGSVIAGALSFADSNRCNASLKNSSECNSYTVSYVVKESIDGRSSTKTSGSVSLNPGVQKTFPFTCDMKRNYRLEISSAKASSKNQVGKN